ncbi:hypothetical protein OSCT_1085 [Oscillochloris trichoides DG-6]|uniref:Uncharacterized protein n=1 Tax=Oscillochloris trichoides DG-6 TaxID=765420 RepID=E1ICN4_9CHLR|nr:hypothetical protein OSCT_1085 [Oscillochloris trichoides DG-6]
MTPASADELRHRGILEEDETLLAIFDGVLLDENRRRIGGVALSDYVALTDKRLVTWARGLFNDTVDSFVWKDVDIARAETWDPWHGRVILAFRLPPIAPRSRRIVVKGISATGQAEDERVITNTLDYMPAEDVTPLANMVAWVGDQVVSGVVGETLIRGFMDQFPAPDRPVQTNLFAPEPPPPPPPPPREVEKRRKNWWQRAFGESEEPLVPNSSNLINAYESRRSSQPAGSGTPTYQPPLDAGSPMSPLPSMMEQPSVYEMSRSIQLFLEAPRRLMTGMRRASEMMSGATDLVSGLQSPQVRRTAMMGIYQAAAQQEMDKGPLAPVAPVLRAAVRLVEPLPDSEGAAGTTSASRRLQIKTTAAAPRRSPPSQPLNGAAVPAAESTPSEAPVRRSINVRRVEANEAEAAMPDSPPPVTRSMPASARIAVRQQVAVKRSNGTAAPEAPPAAEPVEAAPTAVRVPVRRMTIKRNDETPAPVADAQSPAAVAVSDDA